MARWYAPSILFLTAATVASAFLPPRSNHVRSNTPTSAGPLSSSSSINPNDLESPEDRERRMELVRKLQKSYYKDEGGITKHSDGIFKDVPLWRVQWTELPGFQNVLNCHVPHYTHMFMKVLNGPQPWYFGHAFLPGGSENLDNPTYRLCSSGDDDPPSQATHTGTLMKVSDYRQLDDGRLVLIVQALGRFEVVEVTQHVPYAVATVELTPDVELIDAHLDKARELVAAAAAAERRDKDDPAADSATDLASAAWGAARVAAIGEAMHWESFEYRDVAVEECLDGGGPGVSPLANFDADAVPDTDEGGIAAAIREFLRNSSKGGRSFKSTIRPDAAADDLVSNSDSAEKVLRVEKEVWIGVDFMIQLLGAINTNPNLNIPVPTQILGLLPSDEDYWPEGFKLDTYVSRLSLEKASVGTHSKSPFVAVDDASARSYPKLRRAQRLSFAVWCLLDTLLAGYDPAAHTRQAVLELESTAERLEAAKRGLDAINTTLRQALKER